LAWAATAARRALWRVALPVRRAPAKLLDTEAWAAARTATRGATCSSATHVEGEDRIRAGGGGAWIAHCGRHRGPQHHQPTLAEAEDLATVVATARVQAWAAKVAAAMVSAVCG
jgi:hypothetical protein